MRRTRFAGLYTARPGGKLALRFEGQECLRNLLPTARILYMSGYPYVELVRRGIHADISDYVSKPFTAPILVECVRKALGPPKAPPLPGVNGL
jgi:DNA-binding NarL/FixJ family response regulator